MRIGLISDTHNEQQKVKIALDKFRQRAVSTILHAGDITNVATLNLFADFDVWIAQGNMDRDRNLRQTARRLFGIGRMGNTHALAFDDHSLALTHGDSWQRLETLITSHKYDYIIHGHTHVPQDERIGPTRVINPGALGSPRWRVPTCAILDLETDTLEWIEF